MSLKPIVDAVLKEQSRSFSWLASEMDRTIDGLKLALINETIKYSDLKKLVKILNVPVTMLFEGETTVQNIKGSYNTQASKSVVAEPDLEYKKENERLIEQVNQLKSQLDDKNEIISLMKGK
ncbi:MAG: hypothetical protein ACXVIY_03105 [Mucilaginibacter sp.]